MLMCTLFEVWGGGLRKYDLYTNLNVNNYDYNVCFNGFTCYTVSYYSYNSLCHYFYRYYMTTCGVECSNPGPDNFLSALSD